MGRFITNISDLRHETGTYIAVVHHGNEASGGTKPRAYPVFDGFERRDQAATAECVELNAKTLRAMQDPHAGSLRRLFETIAHAPEQVIDSVLTNEERSRATTSGGELSRLTAQKDRYHDRSRHGAL
jgi:hypothetical protein